MMDAIRRPALSGRAMAAIMVLLAALLLAVPAFAQTFPPLSGRVVDQAKLLPADQAAALEAKLAALEQQSGHQVVVATVASLEGYPIEDYGYRLGRAWGLGDKKTNDGLILLIAPNERKMRIEVGYGLEPIVTDALSTVIIQREIRPRFKDGDMAGGIVAGTDALIQLLQLPPDQAQARAQKLVADDARQRDDGGDVPVALIFWIVVLLFILGSSMANRFGGGRRHRGGSGPIVIWGGGDHWGGGSGSGWGGGGGWGGGSSGGGFSGGGGSFGGGGASGDW